MRQVAVTEGDKVEAQMRLGVEVNGYGVGDLVRRIEEVREVEIDSLTGSTTLSTRCPRAPAGRRTTCGAA